MLAGLSSRTAAASVAIMSLVFLSSCSSTYYSVMEKFGVDKRDILVDRVEEARDEQESARDEFVGTLEAFKALTGFDGGELEDRYEDLNDRYEDAKSSADAVGERIEAIEKVGEALFEEWGREAEEINDPGLRSESKTLMRDTRSRYDDMVSAMQRAESKMPPVLSKFRDHVLFLKHNLNARAITSLETQLGSVNSDVDQLIREMESSIAEADSFISQMGP